MKKLISILAASVVLAAPAFSEENPYNPQQNNLQGQVSANVTVPVLFDADSIDITHQPGELGKYSGRKYQAIQFVIKNTSPGHVEILQGEVPGAIDEQYVVQEKEKSAQRWKKGLGVIAGAASAVPFYGGLASGSRTLTYTSIAAQNAVGVAQQAAYVSSAAGGNLEISGRFPQRINNVMLSPNQTFSFTSLLPKEATPTIKIIVKNLQTNQIIDVAR